MRLMLALAVVVALSAAFLLQRSPSVGGAPLTSAPVDDGEAAMAPIPQPEGVAPVRVARPADVEAVAAAGPLAVVLDVAEHGTDAAEVLVCVRDAGGAPVVGAALHTFRAAGFDSGEPPWVIPPSESPVAITDVFGEARVKTESGASTVALVRADALAPQLVTLPSAEQADTPPPTEEVALTPAARAEGLVFGAPAGAFARAVTRAYALQPSAGRRGPFLTRDVQFHVEVGPDGRFMLEDLPTGAPLRFELVHAGRLLIVESDAVMLGAGETRRLDWRVGTGAVARCVVREEDGALAEGIGVWLLSSDEGRPGLAATYWTPTQRRRTDVSGTATFDPVQGGAWIVALEPLERRARSGDAYAPLSVRVDLSDETRETTVELTLTRGRYIRGVIVDPDGAPLRAHLTGHGAGNVFLSENSGADGAFSCGPLVPGTYQLTARMHSVRAGDASYGPSPVTLAEAGAEGVELRLQPGGALTVTASLNGEQVMSAPARTFVYSSSSSSDIEHTINKRQPSRVACRRCRDDFSTRW